MSVENVIATLLPHGKAHASEIARELGVSQRTFARRVSEEGLSFSEVLDGLRSDLANRHLADRLKSGAFSMPVLAFLAGVQRRRGDALVDG